MSDARLKVLLTEDNPGDADLLAEGLACSDGCFETIHVECMEQAEQYPKQQPPPDAILLDLGLPDSDGLATLERAVCAAPGLPIIVLTGLDWRQADSLGLQLVQILAEQLSATVGVHSGEGTAFSVSFGGPNT